MALTVDLPDERTRAIVAFLTAIGIPVRLGPVTGPTAVPAITIEPGGLVLDPDGGHHAGDLLHEAGHLALLPPSHRATAQGLLDADAGSATELGAICWSVAAARHLGYALDIVFHADGYRGDGAWLAETFDAGHAPGLPVLQWAGLTWAPGHAPPGADPYPAMRQWLRTTELATDDPAEMAPEPPSRPRPDPPT